MSWSGRTLLYNSDWPFKFVDCSGEQPDQGGNMSTSICHTVLYMDPAAGGEKPFRCHGCERKAKEALSPSCLKITAV